MNFIKYILQTWLAEIVLCCIYVAVLVEAICYYCESNPSLIFHDSIHLNHFAFRVAHNENSADNSSSAFYFLGPLLSLAQLYLFPLPTTYFNVQITYNANNINLIE